MNNSFQEKKITLCPSARTDDSNSVVFGIIGGTVEQPEVQYLQETKAITEELIELAKPVTPEEVFRIATTCVTSKCNHFDGQDCKLAERVANQLPAVTKQLPPCAIRRDCRWFQQEGKTACLRCPQIVRDNPNVSKLIEYVAAVST